MNKVNLHIFYRELKSYDELYFCVNCYALYKISGYDCLINAYYSKEDNNCIYYKIKCSNCGNINLERSAAIATEYAYRMDAFKEKLINEK